MANVLNKTTLQYLRSVDTAKYLDGEWIINPDLSQVKLLPKKYWKIDGNNVVAMNQSEKDSKDASILPQLKTAKENAIDKRSRELLDQGFLYKGLYYSLSESAQQNWTAMFLFTAVNIFTASDYPYMIIDKDNKNTYNLTHDESLFFFSQGLARVRNILSTGRELKDNVIEASTVAELNAIADNRT